MWFADLYCDFDWVFATNGVLGEARSSLQGGKSASLGIEVEFQFFGDDQRLRHVRILMHTDDREVAQECLNLNIQAWTASLESAVMLETGQSFHLESIGGPHTVMVALGAGDDNSPAVIVRRTEMGSVQIDYRRLALTATWPGALQQHLFYFRRLVDQTLPLDVRWLNGYLLLEWQFLFGKQKRDLPKDSDWRKFVAEFEHNLEPAQRNTKSLWRYLEEARALAAHAGLDNRSEQQRLADPRNAMEKTIHILETMVMEVLNQQFSANGSPIQLHPKV